MKLLVEQIDETTCDFWIKNFQFELFYNLSNHNGNTDTEQVMFYLLLFNQVSK